MQALSRAAVAVTTSVAGLVLVLAGIVMLVTPGPGLLTIAAGLALLARTFPWARRLLDRGRQVIHARLDRNSVRRLDGLVPSHPTPAPDAQSDRTAA